MKTFFVAGTKVVIDKSGGVRIFAFPKAKCDAIFRYLFSEKLIPLDQFKCKR